MSTLLIDSAAVGTIRLAWLSSKKPKVKTVAGKSGVLVASVAKAVSSWGTPTSVVSVAGPGSFTSVRTGVLVANLLSRWYGVPLHAVSVAEAGDLDALSRRLVAGELPAAEYVAPAYDAEPNITLKTVA